MDWNFLEFKTYVLLEAAHADLVFTQDEQDVISKKTSPDVFAKIYKEYHKDTDYQRIEKIREGAKVYCNTEEQKQELVSKIKSLFEADGDVDVMERNLLMFLKKII